jgi:hypothetical protein
MEIVHACCGEIDVAADRFQKAIEERYPLVLLFLLKRDRRTAARQPALAEISGDDESSREGFVNG